MNRRTSRSRLAIVVLLPLVFWLSAIIVLAQDSTTAKTSADKTFGPADLFQSFPKIELGMKFPEVKQAVEKTGAHPGGFKDSELAWDGKFNDLNGRATVLFKEETGAFQIAVIVQVFEKRSEVHELWVKKITERLGAPASVDDNSIHLSKLWRLKDGVVLELRMLKDANNPVLDIHWVK